MTDNASDAAAILDYATSVTLARPVELEPGKTYLVGNPDGTSETIDTEHLLAAPTRAVGVVQVHDGPSLVRMTERFAATPHLYSDAQAFRLSVVLNDDCADGPGWRDHRVVWDPIRTPEWKDWVDGQGLGPQARFAERIEDGAPELVEPAAGVMLDLAQTFSATTQARFRQQARLSNGARQFVYEEEVDAKAGAAGEVTIPEAFTIQVAPFVGSEAVLVTCRLRFAIREGSLNIGYQIVRPHEVEQAAFDALVADVATQLDVEPVAGVAPSAR